MSATLFTGGVICSDVGETDAVLVTDGVVTALGDRARGAAAGVAYQAFAEGSWGRIAPGASADLLWLESDPRTTPPRDLPSLRVRATYLQGQPAYSAMG